jgi:hypothetical protein
MRRECLVLSIPANDLLAADFGWMIAPSRCGALFGAVAPCQKIAPRMPHRRQRPYVVICYPALPAKFMHVIEAPTKTAFGHHHLNHKRIKAGSLFATDPAFVTVHGSNAHSLSAATTVKVKGVALSYLYVGGQVGLDARVLRKHGERLRIRRAFVRRARWGWGQNLVARAKVDHPREFFCSITVNAPPAVTACRMLQSWYSERQKAPPFMDPQIRRWLIALAIGITLFVIGMAMSFLHLV